jgi:tetratricopeptide (TPR) repeat protein
VKEPIQSFDLAFDEICSVLPGILSQAATEEQAANAPFSPLVGPHQSHVLHDIELEIATLRQRCRNGLSLILNELSTHKDPSKREQTPRLKEDLSKAFDSVHSSPTFTQIVLNVVSGQTWREALRLSRDTIDLLYVGAKVMFEDGRFTEAMDSFAFLAWFDARQYDFWMALGHTQFHTALYNGAISSYGIALQCLPEESWPEIYSAACFEALGDLEQAARCITTALTRERKKAGSDQGLIRALEEKLEKYRRRPVTPIS